MDSSTVESLKVKYEALKPGLDERRPSPLGGDRGGGHRPWRDHPGRRGHRHDSRDHPGRIAAVASTRRHARSTRHCPTCPPLRRGTEAADASRSWPDGRLEALVEPSARGDPQVAVALDLQECRQVGRRVRRQGHTVSPRSVSTLLGQLGYSLQSNRKTREGSGHPDRNAQFEHINRRVKSYQRRGQPVVSVDTKKKELVGDFKHGGREWQPKGRPEQVRIHDFLDPKLGKAIPYGVYDLAADAGWVSVGVDHDTAEFAVETLRRWWRHMGSPMYPGATQLLITADGGGSNGSRCRLWKVQLQELADETGLRITVCHFPPGTSKWNQIEHRMFCHITQNWRGRPLVDHEVVVNLIGSTTTETGLEIRAELDRSAYPIGQEVTKQQMESLSIERESFHGDWNYTIRPRAGNR